MIKFEFNNTYMSDSNDAAAAYENTQFIQDTTEKGIVLIDNRNQLSSLTFFENNLNVNSNNYTIEIRFKIHPNTGNTMILVNGTRLPLTILLEYYNGLFIPLVLLEVNGKIKKCKGNCHLEKNKWYTLTFILNDNEYMFKINNSVVGRRVYNEDFTINSSNEAWFRIGYGHVASYSYDNFTGYISYISFDNNVNDSDEDLTILLDNQGYMEIESKYDDLMYDNIKTGQLIKKNVYLVNDNDTRYYLYENGAILWSIYNAVWIPNLFFNKYLSLLNTELVGLPQRDIYVDNKGNEILLFEYGLLINTKKGLLYIDKDFAGFYLSQGLTDSKFGAPISEIQVVNFKEYMMKYIYFENSVLVSYEHQIPFEVSYTMFSEYINSSVYRNACGAIISSNTVINDNKSIGNSKDRRQIEILECKEAVLVKSVKNNKKYLNYIPKQIYSEFEKKKGFNGDFYFPISNPVFSKSDVSKVKYYQDFLGGVIIVYKDGTIKSHTDIKIELSHISCGSIDDGWPDKDPEIYIEVTLERNEKKIVSNERFPEDKKHGNNSFDILSSKTGKKVSYTLDTLSGNDKIYFVVKVSDYDAASANDYLGSYSFYLTIDNGWGLDYIYETPMLSGKIFNGQTIYNSVYAMYEGEDNSNGLTNIKLDFSITEHYDYDIDDFFRKYAFWGNKNFVSTSESIALDLYHEAFSNSAPLEKWYDYLFNPYDALWYELTDFIANGKGGLCFGLSLEALRAIKGHSLYNLPLNELDFLINEKKKNFLEKIYDHEMEDGFARRIKIAHMYQAGAQHVHHILRCIIDSSMTIPIVGLEKAADIISKEGYCLINLTTDFKGHTLLGYKAEYMPEHKSYKIYVADCNYPWWAGLTDLSNYTNDATLTEQQKHSSYIMLSSIREDTLLPQIDIYAKGDITPVKSYRCITVVPYHIVKDQPRTIYPLEFTITLAGFSLAFSTIGIAANLTNLFVMFSLGDTDIEEAKADNNDLKIIDLPSTGSPVRIICGEAKSGNVSIKLRNKNGGLYKARIMSQNKIIDIDSDLERNKIEEIKLTSLNKRRPIIKRQSTDSKLNIKVKNVIRRKELDLSGRRLKKIKKPENIEKPATIRPSTVRPATTRPATSSSSLKRPAKRPLKELKKKDED